MRGLEQSWQHEQATPPPPSPERGYPDLTLEMFSTYPYSNSGLLVQAVIRDQGPYASSNDCVVSLHQNHVPTGTNDFTNMVGLWESAPISPSTSVTMTMVLTDIVPLAAPLRRERTRERIPPIQEITTTLALYLDATGTVQDNDRTNTLLTGFDTCIAASDAYEGDETLSQAQLLTVGDVQQHNADHLGDQDWVRFTATEGVTYTVRTTNLGPRADTYLELYAGDGTTVLTTSDDTNGSLASQIAWVAPATGSYLV